jgi:hypothetical protein
MYDLLDRPVADLPAFERGLLDRTRRWVHALTLAGAAPTAPQGEEAFDAVMRALDAGSSETLVFQRPCHATVEETEAVVIGLWRLVRADRLVAAQSAAGAMLDAANARAMIAAMVRTIATGA